MRDVKALADSMFVAVKGYIGTALAPVVARMGELEKALAAIPTVMDGKDGAPGIDGKDGANGKDGENGERGETGAKGDPGEQGPIGPPGPAGPRGEDGHHGKDGSNGLDGKSGADGKDGRDGRDGKDGANGRDALEIDVLSAIDETRSYPRGTFASHRGGIVRAVRNTDPLTGDLVSAGWSVIVEGLAGFDVVQGEDKRSFTVRREFTSGSVKESVFSMPAMIYRQVYVPGKDYVVGDTVTWDGSLWVCENPTKGQPKLSPDWRLCAKRGSDGKAGKDGKNGERGADGPRGRDLTQLGLDGKKW